MKAQLRRLEPKALLAAGPFAERRRRIVQAKAAAI